MSAWPAMPDNVWSETTWQGNCKICDQLCHWIECPTGGWWSHGAHPNDDHDGDPGWQPQEDEDHNGNTFTVGSFVRYGLT